ncbi:MAG: hypothetical protein ABWY95_06900 [Thermoleophilaceae bacterium]
MAREPAQETVRDRTRPKQLRHWVSTTLATRLSPEYTRRATLLERLTVRRLSWNAIVRFHRYLELTGKLATAVWVGFLVSFVLGLDWQELVRDALNSGKPIERAFVLAIVLPTLAFLVARSALGFARWRLQRELWRRDVERMSGDDA